MAKKKVLLADDVELLLELEKTFLRREEVTILLARNGEEALEIIKREKPNLVFLDMHMPKMDGSECCRRVKADKDLRATPIVLLVKAGAQEDISLCQKAGCDDILHKPINRHYFVETAGKFIFLEGRAAPRVEARLRILYGPDNEDMLKNFTVNVSSGGVFIETEELQPMDSTMNVVFELSDSGKEIKCKSRVAWVNGKEKKLNLELPTGMGVQFQGLALDDLEAIFSFVKKEFISPSWRESMLLRKKIISELHNRE